MEKITVTPSEKEIKIEPKDGYEIDLQNSNLEKGIIKFKEVKE